MLLGKSSGDFRVFLPAEWFRLRPMDRVSEAFSESGALGGSDSDRIAKERMLCTLLRNHVLRGISEFVSKRIER